MAGHERLRRTKSLKDGIGRPRTRLAVIEEHPLLEDKGKTTLVQLHVTRDDLSIRPASARTTATNLSPQGHRSWPVPPKETRPGTYKFDDVPTLKRTPWELDRSKRQPSTHFRNATPPSRPQTLHPAVWLPREILHCVLDHLRTMHSSFSRSALDVPALRNDLRALCITDRRWRTVALEYLYREIWLSTELKPKRDMKRAERMLGLLLRTLTQQPGIASMVRQIRVSLDFARSYEMRPGTRASSLQRLTGRTGEPSEGIALQLLRDIINKCPDLEHVTGLDVMALDDSFGVLDALLSRSKLKSHIWRSRQSPSLVLNSTYFVGCHDRWQHLEMLVLRQADNCEDFGPGVIGSVVQRLPRLQHLVLKALSHTDFHNGILLMLPALRSLRLEELPGITDQGVILFAQSRAAASLERLVLAELELTSLRTIQTLLANTPKLGRFALRQNTSPEVQWLTMATSNVFLESNTVTYLHWDVLTPGHSTIALANSIAAGRFPALRRVKVPCDYDGAVQGLCRPIEQRELTKLDLAKLETVGRSDRYVRSLHISQLQAQLRVRQQRRQTSFEVVVEDDEAVQEMHVIGSYLGNMGSQIEYDLEPDVQRAGVALAELEGLFSPGPQHRFKERLEMVVDLMQLF